MGDLNKKGQVTAFLILGLIIVATILVFFLYVKPNYINTGSDKLYLESCIENAIAKEVPALSLKGGILNSKFNYLYMDQNISFVCYSDEYYKPCVVQEPMLKRTFETNLQKILKPQVEACYEQAIQELVSRGYEVKEGKINFSLSLQPDQINVTLDAPTTISSGDSSRRLKTFEFIIPSEIYNILMVATSLIQFETSYGDSEVSTINFYYPKIYVEKIRAEEGVKLYTITDKQDIEFKFASRSFAWPPGYGIQ